MSFQLGDDDAYGMSEMNLVPLIDIMLVLMIIFLVTSTVINPVIPLTLPKTDASEPMSTEPTTIQVSIDKNNDIFINKKPVSLELLATELSQANKTLTTDNNQPHVNIRADKDSNYGAIAKVLATASNVGLTDIAFVSDSLE